MSRTPPSVVRRSVSRNSPSVTPSPRRSATPGAVVPSSDNSWDGAVDMLKSFGVPLASLALCGIGAVYLTKRMSDLETKVDVERRKDVRRLSETDVRLIVQQMAKDGLINVPQWQQQKQLPAPPQSAPQAPPNHHHQSMPQAPRAIPTSTWSPSSRSSQPANVSPSPLPTSSWKPKSQQPAASQGEPLQEAATPPDQVD